MSAEVFATNSTIAPLESISNASSGCRSYGDASSSLNRKLKNRVTIFSLDHRTGSGRCQRAYSDSELAKLKEGAMSDCQRLADASSRQCHLVSSNGKWIASLSEFADLSETIRDANRLSHRQATETIRIRAVQKRAAGMQFNELGRAIQLNELEASEVFGSSNSFDFSAPLRTTEVPEHDVVALIRGTQSVPDSTSNPWSSKVRRTAIKQLRKAGSAILIAPIQTIGFGFDKAHRIGLALQLYERLKTQAGLKSYDPILVSRAFEPGLRSIESEALLTLAGNLGAHTVVIPYLGHDNAHRIFTRFDILTNEPQNGGFEPISGFEFSSTGPISQSDNLFEATKAPFSAFAISLSERISGATNLQTTVDHERAFNEQAMPALIPNSRSMETKSPADSVATAFQFQWLGSLVPERIGSLRVELFARSLSLLEDGHHEKSLLSAVLKARALAELGSLPAARRILASHKHPLAQAYLAFSKGEIKEMREQLFDIKDGAQKDLLMIDLAMLSQAAEGSNLANLQEVGQLISARPGWDSIIGHRLLTERWGRFENNRSLLPLITANVNRVWTKAESQGVSDPGDDIRAINSIHALQNTANNHCADEVQYCPAAAYVDLLEALVIQASILPIEHLINDQGLYGAGLTYLVAIDTALRGNIEFEKVVASAYFRTKTNVPDTSAIDALNDRIMLAQRFLSTGIEFTEDSEYHPNYLPATKKTYRAYKRANHQNFPRSLRRLPNSHETDTETIQRYLDNQFYYLPSGFSHWIVSEPEFLSQTIVRFGDHYNLMWRLSHYVASKEKTVENTAALTKFSRRLIQAKPDEWIGYSRLGFVLARENNDYEAAARIFGSYPLFRARSPESPLLVGGNAVEAGQFFFQRGHMKKARTFLEVAARLRTGSDGYLTAMQWLAQLSGNYNRSLAFAYARIERYSSEIAVRDALSWQFVMGREVSAWDGFTSTHNQFRYGLPWRAAQVGARRAGYSWADNMAWLLDPTHNQPMKRPYWYNAVTAANLALMDRVVDPRAISDIQSLEKLSKLRPREFIVVPSILVSGLVALRSKNYEIAYKLLTEELLRMKGESFAGRNFDGGAVLPYAAYAAARLPEAKHAAWQRANRHANRIVDAGPLSSFERTLERTGNYYLELAKAFQTGLAGDAQSAVAHLQTAMNYIPSAPREIIPPEFQWAEACEWLYRDTGETIYRDMALNWAQRYQQVRPYEAWPYAIEASLSNDTESKLRAVALLQYLDPESLRLSQIPKAIQRKAIERNIDIPWL